MTNEEAIRACIAHGHNAELQSLVEAGFDTEDALGAGYLKASLAAANTQTKHADDPLTGNKMGKSFRKLLIDGGMVPTIRKSIYDEALKSLGEDLRQPGDTDAKAYVRGLETAEGMALHALYKVAPPDPPQDEPEPPKPAAKGPANIEMDWLAAQHLKANPQLGKDAFGRPKSDGGKAAAYTIVYSHHDNLELRDRVKAEDLAPPLRTPAGTTSVGRNPNWNAAVRETMARTRGP